MSIPKVLLYVLTALLLSNATPGQQQGPKIVKSGSHPAHTRVTMSTAERALVDEAILVVCTQAKLDPSGSLAIDDMQSRPSLPVHSPEAQQGAARAQKLLPLAKSLVISSLNQLVKDYGLNKSPAVRSRLQQATDRVQVVTKVKPDMEARDNASVYLNRPRTITFG